MHDDQFNLGRHEALIQQIADTQTTVVLRLTNIEHLLAEKRGERRVAIWVASSVGGLIGTAATLLAKLAHHA